MFETITFTAAKAAGLKRYYTGEPCSRGHVAERMVSGRTCCGCKLEREKRPDVAAAQLAYLADYRAKNRDKAKEANTEYYAQNADALREYARNRRRENPEIVKAEDRARYERDRDKRLAASKLWYQENKEHALEYSRQWYANRAEFAREYAKQYRRENKERVREWNRAGTATRRALEKNIEGAYTAKDVMALFDSQNGLCNGCGVPVASRFHVDHMQPISRGGTNWPSNLQILCPTCNLSKGAKTMSEWLSRPRRRG